MRLAEALILRSDLSKSIDDLNTRITNNAVIQDGTQPAEDPKELIEQLEQKLDEHEKLVVDINVTNLLVKTECGLILNNAISRRETLSKHHNALSSMTSSANNKNSRYRKTEILNVVTIDIPSIQGQLDDLTKEKREIEVAIQAANWTTELIRRDKE